MQARTLGAICLRPSGNEQGRHYFMCLRTGQRLHQVAWTPLPMPEDAITRVTALGAQQGMPKTLTFSDQLGHELPEADNAVDDDHDGTYAASDASSSSDDDDDLSAEASSHSSSSSSSHSDGDDDDNVAPPLAAPGGPAGVINAAADEADEASTDEASEAASTDETIEEEDNTTETSETEETINDTGHPNPTLAIPDITLSGPTDPPEQATTTEEGERSEVTGVAQPADPPEQATTTEEGERGEITGVGQPGGNTGVWTTQVMECTGVGTTRKQQLHKMQLRHNKRSYEHRFINQHSRAYDEVSKEMALAMIENIESPFRYIFQTEPMSLKKGLKAFRKLGADAVVEELRQLDYMQVITPNHRANLSTDDRHKALNYLMYLKQK